MAASEKTPKHVVPTNMTYFFILWRRDSTRATASSFMRFPDYTKLRTTVGSTPQDEWSARHRNSYLTTHNTHKRHPFPQRDSNPNFQQASCRPHGSWDRQITCLINYLLVHSRYCPIVCAQLAAWWMFCQQWQLCIYSALYMQARWHLLYDGSAFWQLYLLMCSCL